MNQIDNYVAYRERLEQLSDLKGRLAKAVDDRAKVNTKYIKYLEANPHKEEKSRLDGLVAELRERIITMIPEPVFFK